jgi:cell wall-associated NlpC family hydrolase
MQIGDIVLVKGPGIISEAIEWAENGAYSHVCMYAGNGKVIEAQGARPIGYRSLSFYEGHYDIGYVNATREQRLRTLHSAESKIGQKYGWGLIFVLFLKLVLHINRPYNKHMGLVCSNFVVDAWKDGGVIITKDDKPTPQTVADSPEITIEVKSR